MPLKSNFLFQAATIFDNSRWLPFMRFNTPLITPCHLYLNLKFSKFSEFSKVLLPGTLYMIHTLIDYPVREMYVTHVQKIELLFGIRATKVKFFTP